jgi:hypothetical protein
MRGPIFGDVQGGHYGRASVLLVKGSGGQLHRPDLLPTSVADRVRHALAFLRSRYDVVGFDGSPCMVEAVGKGAGATRSMRRSTCTMSVCLCASPTRRSPSANH